MIAFSTNYKNIFCLWFIFDNIHLAFFPKHLLEAKKKSFHNIIKSTSFNVIKAHI